VFDVDSESLTAQGLKKMLRDRGHSDGAVREIMKWYRQNDSDGRS
jgi:hypothetical protein